MEEIKKEESWNRKRILTALFLIAILLFGAYFFKTRVLDVNSFLRDPKSVKGVTTAKENNKNKDFDIQEAIMERINNLKQEVSGLNVLEIASSSPQVQKIINDIKSLEQYPASQVKEICKTICGL